MAENYHTYGTLPKSQYKRTVKASCVSELQDAFVPAFNSEERVSSVLVGVFNILNTCVGGGTLSIPFAFAKCGWLMATVLCFISMVCSIFSMTILCKMSRKLGCSSYSDIMEKALGYSGKRATTGLLFFILILVVIAFLVLLRDIASDVVEFFTPGNYHVSIQVKNLITIVLTAISFPLMTSENLHALRYVSYAGSICVFILLCSIAQKTVAVNIAPPSDHDPVVKWGPDNFGDVLTAIPIIFISFLCQFNVLGVYSDLRVPTAANMGSVINISMVASAILFTAFGLAGYFFAFDKTADNILNNFSAHDPSVLVARVGLAFTLMCQLPMVMVPCRQALYPLLWPEINTADNHSLNLSEDPKLDSHYASPMVNGSPNVGEESTGSRRLRTLSGGHPDAILQAAAAYRTRVMSFATDPEEASDLLEHATLLPVDRGFDIAISGDTSRSLITLILISLALILSETVPGVSTVWAIVGSTLGIAIAFLLPAYSYICIWKSLGDARKVDKEVVGAYGMLALSIILMVLCTYQTISKML